MREELPDGDGEGVRVVRVRRERLLRQQDELAHVLVLRVKVRVEVRQLADEVRDRAA